jgi:hypothetical protein
LREVQGKDFGFVVQQRRLVSRKPGEGAEGAAAEARGATGGSGGKASGEEVSIRGKARGSWSSSSSKKAAAGVSSSRKVVTLKGAATERKALQGQQQGQGQGQKQGRISDLSIKMAGLSFPRAAAAADMDKHTQDPSDPTFISNGTALGTTTRNIELPLGFTAHYEEEHHKRRAPQQPQEEQGMKAAGAVMPGSKRKPRYLVSITVLQCDMEDPTYFTY